MEKIQLELTLDEANSILAALGQQPYLKVADLIQKIQGQGTAQLQASSATASSNAHQNGTDTSATQAHGQ